MPLFALHPLWQILFWISYGAWAGFEIWVFSRDRRAASGRAQDASSIYLIVGLILLAIAVAFASPGLGPSAKMRLPGVPVFFVAIILIWGGLALRLWAISVLGRFFRTTVRVMDDHRLVTTVPYRHLRHPAYTGAIVTISGVGLAMGNWISFLGAAVCAVLAYAWRIHIEEAALRERFGPAFEAHRARTWAVIPFVW